MAQSSWFDSSNYLSLKVQAAIKQLLGRDDLADVANYADEVRYDPNYKYTAPFHFADRPSGYSFEEFAKAIKTNDKGNVYLAILNCERDLVNPAKSRAQKIFALKFLVHFVGDCHQPLHVGHPKDLGGNKTQVKFLNESGNLHGQWDYGLIDHENLNYKQMAVKYDTATPEQIKQ